MAVVGAIAERARAILPVTWDALLGDPRYGETLLRNVIDTVKQGVFGTNVIPGAESSYPLLAIDFAAKLVALELCAPGIDLWMNSPISLVTTGTEEATSYESRVNALKELRALLIEETRRNAADIAVLIGYRRPSSRVPLLSTMDDPLLTPSPQEFPRPFTETEFS